MKKALQLFIVIAIVFTFAGTITLAEAPMTLNMQVASDDLPPYFGKD